jgi:hypothetical protein
MTVHELPDRRRWSPMVGEQAEIISLTLPRIDGFVGVARILVGGLSARLDLPYESLDDLQLAVESVLGDEEYWAEQEATLELAVHDGVVDVAVGPVTPRVATDLEASDEIGLGLVLRRVVDEIGFEDRASGRWLTLSKRVPLSVTRE